MHIFYNDGGRDNGNRKKENEKKKRNAMGGFFSFMPKPQSIPKSHNANSGKKYKDLEWRKGEKYNTKNDEYAYFRVKPSPIHFDSVLNNASG